MKKFLLLPLVLLATGCSIFNFGKSEFSCPGMPEGVICDKASNVYKMTNDRSELLTTKPTEDAKKPEDKGANLLPSRLLAPVSSPMPILEPAKVMRIWVAPYQDAKGDLQWPSHIFTEVTPRKWTIGENAGATAPIIVPLQLDAPRATSQESQSGSPRK